MMFCDETGMNEICSIGSTHFNQISLLAWPKQATTTSRTPVHTWTS